MEDIYLGIDLGQIIIALLFLLIFILFALWGYRNLHQRVSKVEESVDQLHKAHRAYRDIEPEGYKEEPEEPRSEDKRLENQAMSELNSALDNRASRGNT